MTKIFPTILHHLHILKEEFKINKIGMVQEFVIKAANR